MNLLRILLVVLLSTAVARGGAQAEHHGENGVKSFTVSVPDEVFQDSLFTVVFTLKATHWKNGIPNNGNGMRLRGVNYAKEKGDGFTTLITQATYVCSKTGKVAVPQMSIVVDGEVVLSDTATVMVRPAPGYGEELKVATQWLKECGIPDNSISLTMSSTCNEFILFSDRDHKLSVVVARKELWPLVGQPVLAYSTDNLMGNTVESPNGYANMFNYYKKHIRELKKGGRKSADALPYQPANASVKPLLGNLQWGQDEPYNQATVQHTKKPTAVGCVPLASAMIMSHYRWPENIKAWNTLKTKYENHEVTDALPLSQLLLDIALAVDANFSSEATSAAMEGVKRVLCEQYGYSGKITIQNDLKETEMMALIYREIDNGRPCLVSYGNHTFVCDGYNGDFLHYNMGWDGFFNGYYRMKFDGLSKEGSAQNLFIKRIIYGIEPLKEVVSREVTLTEPGTLDSLLSPTDKAETVALKISGQLNSSDIQLIRKMAGGPDSNLFGSWQGGSLMELDLEDASIVNDERPFLSIRGNGKWIHTETEKNNQTERIYDLTRMDNDTWSQFQNDIKDTNMGITYTRDENGYLTAHYNCQADAIGMNMFRNCSSLKTIILPLSIKKVDKNAFSGCQMLKEVVRRDNQEKKTD